MAANDRTDGDLGGAVTERVRPSRAADEVSVFGVVQGVLRHWRLFVIFPVLGLLFAVGRALLSPPEYVATATFVEKGAAEGGSTESVLAQTFGLNIGTRAGLAFYARLLHSRELLESAATEAYTVEREAPPRPLTQMVAEPDAEDPLRTTVRWLEQVVDVSMDAESGFMELTVRAGSPALAQGLARQLLDGLNRLVTEIQQDRAGAEAAFIRSQLMLAQDTLLQAEEDLRRFLERNRRFEDSPQLVLEYEQLQRRVANRNRFFGGLQESYHQAMVSAVRNTPAIVVVDDPEGSAEPASRWLVGKGILGLITGLVLAAVLAGVIELIAHLRAGDPAGYERTVRLLRDVRHQPLIKGRRQSS